MKNIPGDFYGKHTLGELYGVSPQKLNDTGFLTDLLCMAVTKAGATVCGTISKQFEPHGVTVLVLLEESHASFHTYPEIGALFLDIFTCGNKCDPVLAFNHICAALNCCEHEVHTIKRGSQ